MLILLGLAPQVINECFLSHDNCVPLSYFILESLDQGCLLLILNFQVLVTLQQVTRLTLLLVILGLQVILADPERLNLFLKLRKNR